MKRKNCNPAKSYNCGNSCISGGFVCRKDGLKGQAAGLANKVTELIQSIDTPRSPSKGSSQGGNNPNYDALKQKGEDFINQNVKDRNKIPQMNKVINGLKSSSKVTPAQAKKFFETNATFPEGEDKQFMKDVRSDLAEIAVISGTLKPVRFVRKENTPNAWVDAAGNAIDLGNVYKENLNRRRIIMHEYSHHLEYQDLTVRKGSKEARSAIGFSDTPKKVVSPETGNSFDLIEGNFVRDYAGRVYNQNQDATEVLAVGVESMVSPAKLRNALRDSPEHVMYTVGAMLHLQERGGQ